MENRDTCGTCRGVDVNGDRLLTLPQVSHPVPLHCGIPGLAFLSSPELRAGGNSTGGGLLLCIKDIYVLRGAGKEKPRLLSGAVSKNDEILSMIIGLTQFVANMAVMAKSC